MGGSATPMFYSELYTALEQGVLDGGENAAGNVLNDRFYEVSDYLSMTQHFRPPGIVAISMATWNGLTEEQLFEGLRGRRAITIPGTTFAGYLEEWRSGPLPDLEVDFVEAAVAMPAAIRDDPTGTFAYVDYAQYVGSLKAGFPLRRHPVADRVTDVLGRTGFQEVIPVVDGRDVELRGEVASPAEAARAERIVSMVRGVRVVRAALDIGAASGRGGGDS